MSAEIHITRADSKLNQEYDDDELTILLDVVKTIKIWSGYNVKVHGK